MILLLGFSFLAGLVTMITPCMWPMLPIVLSANIKGQNHWRPLGITIGVMASFALFTLSVSYLVRLFHFDPNILRIIAVIVIVFLGLTLIIPTLIRITESLMSRLTGRLGIQSQKGNDFQSGLFTGFILGIVWSPCGGPILASIAVLAATGMVNFQVILVTVAYVMGVGLPLFFFTYGGQRLVTKTRFISSYTGRIQQIFGIIMILTAIAIYFNYDKVLQVKFLQAFPALGQSINGFEKSSIVTQELSRLTGRNLSSSTDTSALFNANYPAPEFAGITKWLNTDHPLTLKELRGKVVLIDFWTYTCINCIRALHFVNAWYEKYKDKGFIVIGVHTPEFEFEKNTNNVLNAIKMYNVHYPVPQDNNYATWNAYNNQYWPADYLIDAKGIIRHTHFGEGEYDKTERAIQALLKEKGEQVNSGLVNVHDQTPQRRDISPETYLGSERMQYLYPNGSTGNGIQDFPASPNLPVNTFSYGGTWIISSQYGMSGKNAVIYYHFNADTVHLVMRPGEGNKTVTVKVFMDDKPVNAGDVKNGIVTVDSDRLYTLIDLQGNPGEHILRLEFETPNTDVFAFTFG